MMSCSEIRPRIALYVDREVTGAEALEFGCGDRGFRPRL